MWTHFETCKRSNIEVAGYSFDQVLNKYNNASHFEISGLNETRKSSLAKRRQQAATNAGLLNQRNCKCSEKTTFWLNMFQSNKLLFFSWLLDCGVSEEKSQHFVLLLCSRRKKKKLITGKNERLEIKKKGKKMTFKKYLGDAKNF
jgi:hypothetical protein